MCGPVATQVLGGGPTSSLWIGPTIQNPRFEQVSGQALPGTHLSGPTLSWLLCFWEACWA